AGAAARGAAAAGGRAAAAHDDGARGAVAVVAEDDDGAAGAGDRRRRHQDPARLGGRDRLRHTARGAGAPLGAKRDAAGAAGGRALLAGVDRPRHRRRARHPLLHDAARMSDGWRAAVDGRLIARCDAHTRRGERLTRDWSVPVNVREPKLHVEPEGWRAGYLRVGEEREIPMQLQNDLRENMPQALLRDLFRPVREKRWVEREEI